MKSVSGNVVALVFVAASGAGAHAGSIVYLENSNVSAVGSTVMVTRLPIKLPSGSFIYKDVTIQLSADGTGALTYSPSTPVQPVSPPLVGNAFKSGLYFLPSNTSVGFAVSGPSAVPGSAAAKWEVNAAASESYQGCGSPSVFYVGALASNPNYARIKAAGITSTEYSYGVVGGGGNCGYQNGGSFNPNALIGFSQSGAFLTVAAFTDTSGNDHSAPITFITYSLK